MSTVREPEAAVPLLPAPAAPVMLPSKEIDSPALTVNDPPALATTSRVVVPTRVPLGTSSAAPEPEKSIFDPGSVVTVPRSAVNFTEPPGSTVPVSSP